MKTVSALIAVAVLLLAATSAEAATFEGRASDGTKVKLKTNPKGKPKLVKFGDYSAQCDAGYTRVDNPIGGFVPKFTEVSRDYLLDQGREEGSVQLDNVSGQVDVVATWKFEARLRNGSWVGSYRSRGNYEQGSERITRCASRFNFTLSPR